MKKIYFVLLTLLISCISKVNAHETYPSLFEAQVGKPFYHPHGMGRKHASLPITQFKVPNYGQSKAFFPEYSISYLNSSSSIALITAERVYPDSEVCRNSKNKFREMLQRLYPKYRLVSEQESPLKTNNEYMAPNENTYFSLNCRNSYGPFWRLHFQFRGIREDGILEQAWDNHFNRS
jgi:hypothetical protein